MNEFERIGLEFDIALENSDYMMDTIYSVLSIEGNNIYLKESSEEEIDDMYTEAVGKFMKKAKKLFPQNRRKYCHSDFMTLPLPREQAPCSPPRSDIQKSTSIAIRLPSLPILQ